MFMVSSFVNVLFVSGMLMTPLGIPPAEIDAVLEKMAPDACLYYLGSAGTTDPNAASGNLTEKFMLDPEVKQFSEQLVPQITKSFRQMIQQQGAPPEAQMIFETVPGLLEILSSEAMCLYVEDLKVDPRGPPIGNGALIVSAKRKRKTIADALEKFAPMLEQMVKPTKIAGHDFSAIDLGQMQPGMPMVQYGFAGDYFILGVGEKSVAEAIQRQNTPTPKWLTNTTGTLKVERRSTVTFADLQKLLAMAKQLAGDNPEFDQPLQASGLASMKAYQSVTGLDKQGWISRTLFRNDGKAEGWLSIMAGDPLKPEELKTLPEDAIIAVAARIEPAKVMEVFRSILDMSGEEDQLDRALQEIDNQFGINVQTNIIDQLGDVVQVYTTPREGDLVTGWTATISLKDQAKASAVNKKIVEVTRQMFGDNPRALDINTSKFGEHQLYTFVVPDDDFMVEPTWCIADGQIVVGVFPQAVKTHLRASKKSLTEAPAVARYFRGKNSPNMVSYADTKAIVQRLYPAVQVFLRSFLGQMQREGFDFNIGLLPSCDAITRNLEPSTQITRWTKLGLYAESRQTIPGGNVTSVAPIAMVGLLPATMQARVAARRVQGINNLKQIALAVLNFESAYGKFPARYNTDDNGKPLLSWRVHVLPFIEEQALYQQFKLDEPWNSPHNRKLIAQMPAVYRSANINTEPGKTVYLSFEDENGVMIPPTKDGKGSASNGVRIGNIMDGMSKTILVAEAQSESAVIWTKPSDFEPDDDDPFKGLINANNNPAVFNAALCDGSVQGFGRALGKELFRLIIQRNDGKPTQF